MSNKNEVTSTINLLVAANFKPQCGVTVRIVKYTPKHDHMFYDGELIEFIEPTSGGFIVFTINAKHGNLEASFFAHGCLVTFTIIAEVAA